MAKIYLIRHCESEGNACRRAQAQSDALVTRKGYEQNEMLRRRFQHVPIDALYSSDAFRSVMTVAPIAQERGLPVNIRILLREITTGIWEDCAWGNIAQDYPEAHKVWTETPWITKVPGATTFQQAADRMVFSLHRIANEIGDGTALVVSHSCSIKATLCTLMGSPMTEVLTYGHGDNTSVSLLDVDKNGQIRVEFMNDASHLPPRLQRAWGGVAGSDINMTLTPCTLDSEADLLAELAEADHRARCKETGAFHREAFLSRAKEQLAEAPGSIAISRLKGKPTGFVRLGRDADLPDNCGVLERYYVIPELQGKGYGEQLFGYAAHEMRYAGKTRLVLRKDCTPEEQRSLERFSFHEMNGHPEYAELDLYAPPLGYPVLA